MPPPLRILWLKTGPLHPLDTGGKLRTYHMLRELARENHVTYLSLLPPGCDAGIQRSATEYSAEQIWIPWRETRKGSPAFLAEVAANGLLSKLPYVIAKYRSAAMAAAIREQDETGQHDLIVCDFLTPAVNLFAGQSPVTPTLLFQHNVESLIWQRHRDTAGGLKRLYFGTQWQRMRRFEHEACGACTAVVGVSEADCAILRDDLGLKNVLGSVPTGVDTGYFASDDAAKKPKSLVFLGSMDWMPNVDGAVWFTEEIWPKIKASEPLATLTIVGRKPAPAIRQLGERDPAIRVTGSVEDVRPYLAEAELMIVPLRIGGGTRIKIFEGMAAGLPVLSTAIGAEGLDVRPGEHLVLADSPGDFSRETLALLAQPERRRSLGESGRRLVREQFSWDAVNRIFSGYCHSVSRQFRGASG